LSLGTYVDQIQFHKSHQLIIDHVYSSAAVITEAP